MAAENRHTVAELAALTRGHPVTVGSGAEFGGGSLVECSGLRDGVREGGADRAELVRHEPLLDGQAQQHARQVDRLYRD